MQPTKGYVRRKARSTSRATRTHREINPTEVNPITGAPGVLQYAGVDFGRQAYDTNYDNFGPRAAFAWDVNGNGGTIVRGGYGILYYQSGVYEHPETQGFSATTQFQSTQGTTFPAFQLVNLLVWRVRPDRQPARVDACSLARSCISRSSIRLQADGQSPAEAGLKPDTTKDIN